ncbi:hypothetical protein MKX03_006894 [Papaver bracteatum]|nr:hypothetical protein MKX03_006894 [Papaver bracteatum]
MALRATGRLLYQRLSIGVSRNFSAKAVSSENVQKKLLDERREKMILAEIRALTASAENNIVGPFLLHFLTVRCLLGTTYRQRKKYVPKSSHRYVFVCHMYGG